MQMHCFPAGGATKRHRISSTVLVHDPNAQSSGGETKGLEVRVDSLRAEGVESQELCDQKLKTLEGFNHGSHNTAI